MIDFHRKEVAYKRKPFPTFSHVKLEADNFIKNVWCAAGAEFFVKDAGRLQIPGTYMVYLFEDVFFTLSPEAFLAKVL